MTATDELAAVFAQSARRLADCLEDIFRHAPASPLKELFDWTNAFFETTIDPDEFADACAQIIAYALFVSRWHPKTAEKIPKPHPFLRKLFDYLGSPFVDEPIRLVVDEIAEIAEWRIQHSDQETGEGTTHFYENFLKAYNPLLRKSRGVFYTPQPAVMYIVRAVDALLRKEFCLHKGLADNVPILDPATGTGTFFEGVIRHIFPLIGQDTWNSYVADDLLPHLHGFEVMMTPYIIAHLKLAMLLEETGCRLDEKHGFKLHLTNALEARGGKTKFLVILGNPPYNVSTINQGEHAKKLTAKYKEGLQWETNIQPLSDDYIKFIALGQHLIAKNNSGGILAYISNNGFLDGIIHRQMRKSLLETFDKIYILNLHGNTRRKETAPDGGKDENVFNILQGTSINIFICQPSKNKTKKKEEPCKVFYADVYGKRSEKLRFLETHHLETTGFTELPLNKTDNFFVPKDFSLKEEYGKGFSVNELFIKHATGIKFRRDNLLVKNHYTRQDVETMLQDIALLEKRQLLEKYKTKETRDWQLNEKRKFFLEYDPEDIKPVLYRVFDTRWTFYPMDKISQIIPRGDARKDLMQHLIREKPVPCNPALLTLRNQPTVQPFDRIFIASGMIEHCVIGRGTYAFPLYCYGENGVQYLNLNEIMVSNIANEIGNVPTGLDVFDYVYGVLHNPMYRAKYQEFLKIDFPRVPYPGDAAEFDRYRCVGARLRKLHLLEDVPVLQTSFPVLGNDIIDHVHFVDDKVFINAAQYFEGIQRSVWEFSIGGSCPAQKYLKDRKGRILTVDEIQHYQKAAAVLSETILILADCMLS